MSGPIPIRRVTVRHCREVAQRRGTYSDGSKDPEWMVWLFVSIGDGRHTGYGECIPTSLFYEPGHIGRSGIDEWRTVQELRRVSFGYLGNVRNGRSLSAEGSCRKRALWRFARLCPIAEWQRGHSLHRYVRSAVVGNGLRAVPRELSGSPAPDLPFRRMRRKVR